MLFSPRFPISLNKKSRKALGLVLSEVLARSGKGDQKLILTNSSVINVVISSNHAQIQWRHVHFILNGYTLEESEQARNDESAQSGQETFSTYSQFCFKTFEQNRVYSSQQSSP